MCDKRPGGCCGTTQDGLTSCQITGSTKTKPGGSELAPSKSEKLLAEAMSVVRDRREKYGPPGTSHFVRTVAMINALFTHKLKEPLTPADWAQAMILDKLARYQGPGRSSDCPVDLAGYAACLAEVEEIYG